MGKGSSIQWTRETWNPWHGCIKVSAGCKYCYMYRDKERYGKDPTEVVKSKNTFNDPLKWRTPTLIFTCSWSDWFIEQADEWRKEAWEIIKKTPWHTYQILTKRPERIKDHLPLDWGDGYPNVWLGVSVENQEAAYTRIPILLNTPAKVRFLSCEPLLDRVDLTDYILNMLDRCPVHGVVSGIPRGEGENYEFSVCPECDDEQIVDAVTEDIDWVIVGGESGNDTGKYLYRPCELDWIKEMVETCRQWGVPVFVKQLGTHLAKELNLKDRHGGDMDEFPEGLKMTQFPKSYKPKL